MNESCPMCSCVMRKPSIDVQTNEAAGLVELVLDRGCRCPVEIVPMRGGTAVEIGEALVIRGSGAVLFDRSAA